MKSAILFILLLAVISLSSAASSADNTRTTAAVKAAENFLLLLDTGQYGQSWDVTASLFKKQVPKESWIRQVSGLLPSMGMIKDRSIISADFTTELPGAPAGEYVIIRYRSSFTNKEEALETVTPMLDKDGQWRVSGYYIK